LAPGDCLIPVANGFAVLQKLAEPSNRPPLWKTVATFRKLFVDDRAAISVLSALSLVVVIGISALSVEFGHALLQRSDNQRVADLAAYSGALVYNFSGSNAAKNAALNIAALNGFTSGNATVTGDIVASPRGNGNLAVQVTVTTRLPLYLARVLTSDTNLSVAATSYAEIEPGVGNGGRSTALLVQ
jgi:uncharacterized membrane protein